jgi:hypothetical protein
MLFAQDRNLLCRRASRGRPRDEERLRALTAGVGPMTEQEWLTSQEPELMVPPVSYHLKRARTTEGRRKLRLFGCACCRRVAHLFPEEPWWPLVALAEKLADGAARQSDLDAFLESAGLIPREGEADHVRRGRECLLLAVGRLSEPAAKAALACSWIRIALGWLKAEEAAESAVQADLLRCIFGNPFRPPIIDPSWIAWNGGAVVGLAGTIYEERRFEDMPVLADALEAAGCFDEEVLGHLRGPGPHARGCFVIDLLKDGK